MAEQPAGTPEPTTEQEMDILELCKSREEAGMARTRNWTAMWDEALRYFLSDQLRGQKNFENWDWVILNYIWPAIFQEIAKLSRDFKPVVSPIEQSDVEIADAMGGFLNWQWQKGLHRQGMRIEQLRAILDRKLYGYSVSKIFWEDKVHWNDQQRRWEGQVRHRLWHPALFWCSDNEYINDGDCGTVRYLELAYAQSLWPGYKKELYESSVGHADMLKDGGGESISGQTSTTGGSYPSAGVGAQDKDNVNHHSNELLNIVLDSDRRMGGGDSQDKRRFVKISEAYLKDPEEKHHKDEIPFDPDMLKATGQIVAVNGNYYTPDGQEITSDNWPNQVDEWDEPLYPNGRYIIRCEDTILNPDRDDQKYPFKVWPFIVVPHYLLPHMWQGSDAVTLYKNTQDHINITISHLHNAMKEFGDPKILVESDALATPPGPMKRQFSILKGAGAIIRLARGGLNRIQIRPPVPPSPAAMALYQLFVQEYKNIQGMQDIAQGKKTSGQITATEAQFLAISSNDRIKLQNIFEEDWAKQIFSITAEMDQFYYEVDRVVRIIGDDLQIGGVQITDRSKEIEFDVDIEVGEGLPWDEEKRIVKYEKAYQLLSDPAPNPLLPEMLRVLGITGWQRILQKHQGWQKYVAFEQLKQAVFEGKVSPEDAVKLLIQQAMSEFQARPQTNEVQNGNSRTES